jgi:hypothetical protein
MKIALIQGYPGGARDVWLANRRLRRRDGHAAAEQGERQREAVETLRG